MTTTNLNPADLPVNTYHATDSRYGWSTWTWVEADGTVATRRVNTRNCVEVGAEMRARGYRRYFPEEADKATNR